MQPFATEVRRRAAALRITQAEIARRSGVSIRAFSHYLSERSEPNLATLVRIADALDCTPNDLLGISRTVDLSGESEALRQRIATRCRQLDGATLRLTLLMIGALDTWQTQMALAAAAGKASHADGAADTGDKGQA